MIIIVKQPTNKKTFCARKELTNNEQKSNEKIRMKERTKKK